MEKPSIRERAGNHPVPLRNAIQALSRRWAYMGAADVEFLAPPESLRVSGAEVREALGRRLRALQGLTEPKAVGRKRAACERHPGKGAGSGV